MDFNEEIAEFLNQGYIKNFKIVNWINPITANCEIVTLEDIILKFTWSKAEAIKLESCGATKISPATKYETIEQLLTNHSKKYKDSFSNDLFAKLTKLQQLQEQNE